MTPFTWEEVGRNDTIIMLIYIVVMGKVKGFLDVLVENRKGLFLLRFHCGEYLNVGCNFLTPKTFYIRPLHHIYY